jgi:hypothetical protein
MQLLTATVPACWVVEYSTMQLLTDSVPAGELLGTHRMLLLTDSLPAGFVVEYLQNATLDCLRTSMLGC